MNLEVKSGLRCVMKVISIEYGKELNSFLLAEDYRRQLLLDP